MCQNKNKVYSKPVQFTSKLLGKKSSGKLLAEKVQVKKTGSSSEEVVYQTAGIRKKLLHPQKRRISRPCCSFEPYHS